MLRALSPVLLALTALGLGCHLVVESDKFNVHGDGQGGLAGTGGTSNGSGGDTTTTSSGGGGGATTSTGGSGGAGGVEPPPDCSTAGNCDACQICIVTPGAPCIAAMDACNANPECVAILSCVSQPACGPTPEACYQSCGTAHPQGVTTVLELADCVFCGQCVALCPEYGNLCF